MGSPKNFAHPPESKSKLDKPRLLSALLLKLKHFLVDEFGKPMSWQNKNQVLLPPSPPLPPLPAPIQRQQNWRPGRQHVQSLGRAPEPQAAAQKLVRVQRAVVVQVEDLEDLRVQLLAARFPRAHWLSGWPKKSPNFMFTTKTVFPESLKFMNSGSESPWSLLPTL